MLGILNSSKGTENIQIYLFLYIFTPVSYNSLHFPLHVYPLIEQCNFQDCPIKSTVVIPRGSACLPNQITSHINSPLLDIGLSSEVNAKRNTKFKVMNRKDRER